MKQLRVLELQPFFGGSHQDFSKGWRKYSEHHWTTLTLPARHWKWRMRHAAITFAEQLKQKSSSEYDLVFGTDMLNLAEWKGLVGNRMANLPAVIYFHENQLTYPNRFERERDLHFGFTNFTTALAADAVWFNSEFNRKSFLSALKQQASQWPDHVPADAISAIEKKSDVRFPGIDFDEFPAARKPNSVGEPVHLLWCARWEHDKNPDDLLIALRLLRERQIGFRLSVIGQSFREVPEAIQRIKEEFAQEIVNWGYQPTRADYWQVLRAADFFVSTAKHEFFGLSALEAISAGAIPILPNRLAYPEVLSQLTFEPSRYLYDGSPDGLVNLIVDGIAKNSSTDELPIDCSKFHWPSVAAQFDEALVALTFRTI